MEPRRPRGDRSRQDGALLVTVLVVMVPLLVLITGATTVMTGRNSALLQSIQEHKALLAAEAGIAEAAQMAHLGTLVPGELFTRDLGGGMTNSVSAAPLWNDGLDNDGDTLVDEPDERSFEVLAYGYHGQATRRLAATIVEPAPPPIFRAAILALGEPEIVTTGGAEVIGFDTNINGTRGLPVNDVAGIANEPPYDTTGLVASYEQKGSSLVSGAPALATTPTPFNLPGLMVAIENSVDNQLSSGTLNSDLGSAAANDWQVSFCPGDLQVTGSMTGAGILLVGGDLSVSGGMRWDGLVVVLGDFKATGSSLINGALIQGPDAAAIDMRGESMVRFSTEALSHIYPLLTPDFGIRNLREVSQW